MGEKDIQIKADNRYIDAVINIPDNQGDILAIFVHGFAGNKNENGLFTLIAKRLEENDIPSIRFDFTRFNDSQNAIIKDIGIWNEDLESIIKHSAKYGSTKKILFIGFSLGTVNILKSIKKRRDIVGFVFLSPAFQPDDDMYPRYKNNPVLTSELEKNGYITKNKFKIGRELIEQLGNLGVKEEARKITEPVLIIHGTNDDRIPITTSEKYNTLISKCELAKIEGANHSFSNIEDDIPGRIIDWLKKNLQVQTRFNFTENVYLR